MLKTHFQIIKFRKVEHKNQFLTTLLHFHVIVLGADKLGSNNSGRHRNIFSSVPPCFHFLKLPPLQHQLTVVENSRRFGLANMWPIFLSLSSQSKVKNKLKV
jgi:hypothetical protein